MYIQKEEQVACFFLLSPRSVSAFSLFLLLLFFSSFILLVVVVLVCFLESRHVHMNGTAARREGTQTGARASPCSHPSHPSVASS